MKIEHLKKTFLIPLAIVILFSCLNLFSFYTAGEHIFFDLFLHLTKGPPEDRRIVLLNIDDLAIARVGMFPWSRSIMADGLITMKEMGAAYAVFDIEYTEKSPMGLNSDVLKKEIPKSVKEQMASLSGNTTGLFQAIASGNISLKDAADYIYQLEDLNRETRDKLLAEINEIARDNDEYFGQAAAYFEKACFTVNILSYEEEEYSAEHKKWVRDNLAVNVTLDGESPHPVAVDIRPAVAPILQRAASAGFPNVVIDPNGVRRRVDLLAEYDGVFFPQLSFQAVYDLAGRPELILSKDSLIMKDARFPGEEVQDLEIPLDPEGHFVINWPRKEFEESFKQLSYYYLILNDQQEELLIQNLEIMKEAGYLNYYRGNQPLLDLYDYGISLRQQMLSEGDMGPFEDFLAVRKMFFEEADNFLNGDSRDSITDRIDQLLENPDVPESQKEQYQEIRDSVITSFSETGKLLANLMETRTTLTEALDGAICYLGWTGTATTDRGVNPFDGTYDNVGTHASIANTILNRDFIDQLPLWPSIIAAILIVIIYYITTSELSALPSILAGIGFNVFILVCGWLVFQLTNIYVPILTPMLATIITFVALTVVNLLSTSQEKAFIRNAFGQYLSNDVINDLLENPDKLNLGGEKKVLTALFTDVQGFSTISEAMDPTDLVTLLNMYLTKMSDILMDHMGTIDKFEGDAIISFFGAPNSFSDHAYKACLAAVLMKRAENIMNEKVMAEKMSPNPLLTRIGINTGDIVVGNMGTAKKMDYTMMGNAVNLAARLEGVNKRYGTYVMMSDATYEAGGKEFATRRLDRVRVVGIHTPVRLYELIEEKSQLTKEKKILLKYFEKGLTIFEEERDWKQAFAYFKKVLSLDPSDGPAKYYLEKCKTYFKEPPAKDWDGVYSLTEK
ncbi:MAG: adenylate/guanylate cyclase domain-containing protein [Spirochaetales bacterium]|nr:adenylate/guanylate cyclase domain-containing protein [Spirochaetales bacterium]